MTTNTYSTDDEIDLKQLWQTILKGKKIILTCVLFALFLAATYLFFTKEEFKATVYLLPPDEKDITELNQIKSQAYTPRNVFQLLLVNLESRAQKQLFFDEQNILPLFAKNNKPSHATFNNKFLPQISVKGNSRNIIQTKDFSGLKITLQLPTSPDKITTLTNLYVQQAIQKTKIDLIANVKAKIQNKAKGFNLQISNKIGRAAIIKNDRILALKEALDIAQTLNIKDPIMDTQVVHSLQASVPEIPLFYQGHLALTKEISILESRSNEKAFVPGLRDLQAELAYNQSLKINPYLVKVAKVDSWAYPPEKPTKPKRSITFFLAFLAGALLGLFIVLFRSAFHKKANRRGG